MRSRACLVLGTGSTLLAIGAAIPRLAIAESGALGRFEARYAVSIAGVTIGKGAWLTAVDGDHYTTSATGEIAGILRAFGSAHGSAAAAGSVQNGQLIPSSYAGHLVSDDGDEQVRMSLDAGVVTKVSAEPPFPVEPDRVPLTDADRRGVIDPISAGLIPVAAAGEMLTQVACNRTLPVFDGRQRFDVVLSFKRMDKVTPERGYHGPALVCAVRYQPIAGYRRDRMAVKYLTEARDTEMWLVPLARARILVPARVSVPTLVGTALVEANLLELTNVAGGSP
jgi:hypothetical protein